MEQFSVGDTVKVINDAFHSGAVGKVARFSINGKFIRIDLPTGGILTRVSVDNVRKVEGNPTPDDAGQGDTQPLQIGKIEQLTTVSSQDAFTNAAVARGVKVTVAPVITPERLEAMQAELDTLRAENAKLRAALDNHGLWVDFNHLSKVLEDIRVANWLTVHARALGFAIGYFRHLQSVLDGKED